MTSGPLLEVRGVSKRYRRGTSEISALDGVSFEAGSGSAVAIMGPSGSGKTTLLNLLAGLDHPTSGEILVAGTRLDTLGVEAATTFRRRHLGFVFQFFNLLSTMSALENVGLPLLAEGLGRRELRDRASAALAAVGLAQRASHRPDELSGGEQQRVAIARAIVMRPRVLLADEPTGNLDSATGSDVLRLLRAQVDETRMTLVMVTHAPAAADICDRVVTIRDGRIVGDGHRTGGRT